jgi:hypothetical protein
VSAAFQAPDPNYVFCLRHNFPTVYRIPSILGYERLASQPAYDEKSLYQYGVKYILFHNPKTNLSNAYWTPFPDAAVLKLNEILKFGDVTLYELDHTLPLSFLQSDPTKSFPIVFTGRGAITDVSSLSQPSDIVVNLSYRDGMVALADGKRLKISSDDWQRIVVLDCPVIKNLEIRYNPPWNKGFILAGVMLVFSIGCMLQLRL